MINLKRASIIVVKNIQMKNIVLNSEVIDIIYRIYIIG